MNIGTPFSFLIQEDIREAEILLRSQISGHQPELDSALDVILSAGGKRIRPTITLLVGKMMGGPREQLISLAAAIEALHTATLIHDDLIDGSILRRGIPTLNSKWNPGATVLTGDLLFSVSAKLAANTDSIRAIKLFSQTLIEIVNGEVSQLLSGKCKVNKKDYYERIYAKTASLFKTATCTAAILSTTDEQSIDQITEFGRKIGIAFQIIDDILDFTGEQVTVGKPIGSDLRQGLITLPTIIYMESHLDLPAVKSFLDGNCPNDQQQIEKLIGAIRNSDAIEKSYQEAGELIESALIDLRNQPKTPEREALEDLAQYIIRRNM